MPLTDCHLCEWHCGVDRTRGELGVCRIGMPQVASRMLHPAPPESYTIFTAGCNFRCLHCQNWDIAHFPDTGGRIDGETDPAELARESLDAMRSMRGRLMGADRLFFSGGSATCSLPFVEAVVAEARRIEPQTKVNYDTNGFMTEESLQRVLDFTTSITFDIRAVHDDVHRAMTGAPVEPVLRNAAVVARHREKLWEFRILVVPGVNEAEIEPLCRLLADIDATLPVCFLAFRPNFVMARHTGAGLSAMEEAVATAHRCGLGKAYWSGRPGISGTVMDERTAEYERPGARLAGAYAERRGCVTHPRDCGACAQMHCCPIKGHLPPRRT
ncbi:MAG: radical SAM protein [Armatimonadota bacterium]|jgi:pyruvate formate lyase activating enzyme